MQEEDICLSQSVYQYLLDMILTSQIKPGEKIPEAKIATKLGISRTPIRDALRQLENLGIINIYPKRFAEVATYDDDYIKQLGIVRISLDIVAAKLAVHYGSNAQYESMRILAQDCYDAAIIGDVPRRIRKDSEFHIELCKIANNKKLLKFQAETYLSIEFIQACRYVEIQSAEDQLKDHLMIVEYLCARDIKKLCSTLSDHNAHIHFLNENYNKSFFLSDI